MSSTTKPLRAGTTPECNEVAPAAVAKPYLTNLRALRSELRKRGHFRKDPAGVIGILAFHSVVFAFGLSVFLLHESLLVKSFATIVWGYGLTGIAANTHSSSHYATTKKRWLNRLLTYLGYPLVTGFSACYWWHKHIVLHHRHPNLVDHDVDIEWMPIFALTEVDLDRAGPWMRMFYRIQGIFVPLAISFNMTFGQWHSIRFLWLNWRGSGKKKWSYALDAACLILHFGLWIGLPMLFFSPWEVLGFYLLRNTVLGYTFFLLNAPSHYPAEAVCLAAPESEDFVYRQTATTLNYRVGWLGRLLCSGVEFQIEHHLFPSICHTRLPKISPLVKEYCEYHGYPYRTLGWSHALSKAIFAFCFPKQVVLPPSKSDLKAIT
jgi:linoleoyl-CoA desaturase